MSDALSRMEGGSHYLKNAIQPVQFAVMNDWDFTLGSALKYLTRWRDKAGAQDLLKARHFIELREAIPPSYIRTPSHPAFTMEQYIDANKIPNGDDGAALLALDIYAHAPTPANRGLLFRCIDRLLAIAA